jgi:MATE family multidrug resistance protein
VSFLRRSRFDSEILRLGAPALGALAADPLVSLVDTAYVGRLGASALGSLAVAAAVFGVAFALFNFLAYGTTPLVARALGRGDRDEAGRVSVAAAAIGLGLGLAGALVLLWLARDVLGLMGAGDETLPGATSYLRIRALALPAVMLVMVGHGVFRGYQDTRTPLIATVGLNVINVVLDPIFIFGLDGGLEGAAWASVIAQWSGAVWFGVLLLRRRTDMGLAWRLPERRDVALLLGAGRALVIRTMALLGALTLATAVAARIGTNPVAAHQIMFQIWLFLSLALDALAIAGQAMIGKTLARDRREAAEIARRLLVLGSWAGVGVAIVLGVVAPWVPGWFTSDESVADAFRGIYPFLVVMQPLNALVFVWDGIVMGATDFSYLAKSVLVSAVAAVAVLLAVLPLDWGLAGVWWAVTVLMVGRALTLLWWQMRGPLASSRGRFPSSREA